ncbi:hypothetical protein F5B20DRAFT_597377 [Whalleya microplaca]|nr:hypothetical protein F5B20DRAFT_597377 [Whalleya microplaca]
MCVDLEKATFTKCGHQPLYFACKTRFCLFDMPPKGFHMAHTIFNTYEEFCPECSIRNAAKTRGLKGKELREHVATEYSKTSDSASEAQGKLLDHKFRETEKCLTKEEISKLNPLIKTRIQACLGKKLDANAKYVLLDTILYLPDYLDKQDFVTFFASHYGVPSGDQNKFSAQQERDDLFDRARKARLSGALNEGFKLGPTVRREQRNERQARQARQAQEAITKAKDDTFQQDETNPNGVQA